MVMRYGKSLYRTNDTYTVHAFENREDWLKGRQDLNGIGGSDASAALGMNPWRTNLELWEIKTGKHNAPDISDNDRVWYGTEAEQYLRRLFQLKHAAEYEIQYMPDVILQNNEHPEFLYSPDGLIHTVDGKNGILEIKTTTIMKSYDREKWFDKRTREKKLPENYYIQVLHGLNVTGFSFVDLFAELTYPSGTSELITCHIERDEVEGDLKYIEVGLQDFWRYVKDNREPALLLPAL
ncbi:MAG: YqaJ viral recombinase family protein [Solobacterium sp.]|nr:YqaJ viral recombinase family protein [Solobacterium sp.]